VLLRLRGRAPAAQHGEADKCNCYGGGQQVYQFGLEVEHQCGTALLRRAAMRCGGQQGGHAATARFCFPNQPRTFDAQA